MDTDGTGESGKERGRVGATHEKTTISQPSDSARQAQKIAMLRTTPNRVIARIHLGGWGAWASMAIVQLRLFDCLNVFPKRLRYAFSEWSVFYTIQ